MSQTTLPRSLDPRPAPAITADAVLRSAARLWVAVAVVGQWAFFYYIAGFYGPSTLSGQFAAWRRNKMLTMSYVAGDMMGNLAFAAHVLLAGVIAFGGALQVATWLRVRSPALHRWNGRLFMLVALGVSLSGLYIVWGRGDRDGVIGGLGVSLNAVLIIVFVAIAWRSALARDFAAHRRMALRAWLAANGQWFTRIGFVAVGILAPAWVDRFFPVWSFTSTLAPLLVLEVYLRVGDRGGPAARLATAAGLLALTGLTGLGMVGAYIGLWRPLLAT